MAKLPADRRASPSQGRDDSQSAALGRPSTVSQTSPAAVASYDEDDHLDRLTADQELFEALKLEGFEGPVWDRFVEGLARYGFQVVRAWVLSMRIVAECRRKGVRLTSTMVDEDFPLVRDAAEELAAETVALAIKAFRGKVLLPGRWSLNGGASLTTFFIGQCLLQFPNVYRRWARENRPLGALSLDDKDSGLYPEPVELSLNGDPARAVELRLEAARALAEVAADDRTRAMLLLRAWGYSNVAAAELLGVTEKAVESALHRHRQRLRRRPAFPASAEGGAHGQP